MKEAELADAQQKENVQIWNTWRPHQRLSVVKVLVLH